MFIYIYICRIELLSKDSMATRMFLNKTNDFFFGVFWS